MCRFMHRTVFLLLLTGTSLVPPRAAFARTWHVPADVATIPVAADAAAFGDTVLVAPGRYDLGANDEIVVKDGVVVTSEAGPVATRIVRTVCFEASVFRVVDAGSDTEISGFIVTGSSGSCFPSTFYGVTCINASPKISELFVAYWEIETYTTGICCVGSGTPEVAQCTFWTDTGIWNEGANPAVHHNLFMGGGYACWGGAIESSCNDFATGLPQCDVGPGDFAEDPLLCDPDRWLPTLDAASPCVHGYGCGLIGAFGVECGATTTEPSTWGRLKTSFRGE